MNGSTLFVYYLYSFQSRTSPSAVRQREEGAQCLSLLPTLLVVICLCVFASWSWNFGSGNATVTFTVGVKSNESDPLTFYCVGQTARIGKGPNRYRTNAVKMNRNWGF